MLTVKFNEDDLKIINNKNEKLDIDLYIYATCTKYLEYLKWINYFGGLISQEHLEKFVKRKGTSYREDLIELEKGQIIKKFDLGKHKLVALTKRSF